MDGRKLNVISHVSLTSRQLRDLAEEVEMPFLTYLLGMVILEAEKALQDGRVTKGFRRRLWLPIWRETRRMPYTSPVMTTR